jgi:hypothetical protein
MMGYDDGGLESGPIAYSMVYILARELYPR